MDIYRALIGEPPTEEEKLQAIATQLRARANAGLLAQTSGNRYIAPAGKDMIGQSDQQAQQLGVRGEQARYRQYQEGASNRMDERARAEQAWREQDAIARRKHEIALEMLRQRGDLAVAGMKGSNKYRNMTVKQVEDLTNDYNDYRQFGNTMSRFQDDYARIGPMGRPLANSAARYGFGTKQSKDAAEWWAEYNNLYTLPKRNETFGATLTPNEKKEWEENAISPNMSASQIRSRMGWYHRKWQEKSSMVQRNLKAANYDPDTIDTIFSSPTDAVGGQAPMSFEEWKKAKANGTL